MSGYIWDLSEDQKTKLDELREKLTQWCMSDTQMMEVMELWRKSMKENGENEDSLLLRFLRARRWELEKSFQLLKETIVWRLKFHGIGVDKITEEMVVNELRTGKSFLYGKDKEGRPVSYIRVRLHKPSQSDRKELEKMTVWLFEQGRKIIAPPIETTTLIFDMSGFSLENMDYSFTQFLVETFAYRYPESFGLGLIVDSPWVFWACWKVISPWLNSVTVEKIKFVRKSEVAKFIPEDELLADYGGKCPFTYSYPPPEGSISVRCALLAKQKYTSNSNSNTNSNATAGTDASTIQPSTPSSTQLSSTPTSTSPSIDTPSTDTTSDITKSFQE